MDFESVVPTTKFSMPEFITEAAKIVAELNRFEEESLKKTLAASDKIVALNRLRFEQWQANHSTENSRQALYAFHGDAFVGFETGSFSDETSIEFAQQHLVILSGLYGLLRPLDLIQPYRLDIGSKFKIDGQNLYKFWLNQYNQYIAEEKLIINLASNEYFSAFKKVPKNCVVVTPNFLTLKDGKKKSISSHSKKARGNMARWIIDHKVSDISQLRNYNGLGYEFDQESSDLLNPCFILNS